MIREKHELKAEGDSKESPRDVTLLSFERSIKSWDCYWKITVTTLQLEVEHVCHMPRWILDGRAQVYS